MSTSTDGEKSGEGRRKILFDILERLALYLGGTLFVLSLLAFKLYVLIAPIRETLIAGCLLLVIWALLHYSRKSKGTVTDKGSGSNVD